MKKIVWMLVAILLLLGIFSSDNFTVILVDNLYIIFFVIVLSVSSMLLVFLVVEEIFPPQIKATTLAIVNMVIGLCGAIFSVYLNGGPLTEEINMDVFDRTFILSTIIIFTTVVEKYRTREISLYSLSIS
ncbi:hypothetical protein FSC845_06375 [Francisella persica ATCC VR-331]|nr:hypothetical protein FSC845_06375 [Francisella persica ATCC VR-331]